jgi:hypothetical protein
MPLIFGMDKGWDFSYHGGISKTLHIGPFAITLMKGLAHIELLCAAGIGFAKLTEVKIDNPGVPSYGYLIAKYVEALEEAEKAAAAKKRMAKAKYN